MIFQYLTDQHGERVYSSNWQNIILQKYRGLYKMNLKLTVFIMNL